MIGNPLAPAARWIAALALLLCARAEAELPGYAIVLAGGLRVRNQAGLTGVVLGSLKEGETVAILDRSGEQATIGGATDYWYHVKGSSLEGWVYGYYLSREVRSYEESSIVVYSGRSMADPLRSYYHAFALLQERSFSTYEELAGFSGSGRYYFASGRQDVVGRIRIVETISGRTIAEHLFTGTDPEWVGDELSYLCVTGELGTPGARTQRVGIRAGRIVSGPGGQGASGEAGAEEGSWDRRLVYESPVPGERLYHPRAWTDGETTWFVFMGVRKEAGEHVTVLYELREDLGAREIDRFSAAERELREMEWVLPEEGAYLRPYLWRQSDNFVIDDGLLCYYREPLSAEEEPRYFVYETGGDLPPAEVPRGRFEEVRTSYSPETFQHLSLAPDGRTIAFTSMYDVVVRPLTGDFAEMAERKVSGYDLPPEPWELSLKDIYAGLGIPSSEGILLVGVLSWSADSRSLCFDNSGIDYRCIWRLDVAERSVTKIVPEHDAIHPFCYEQGGVTHVAYVTGSALMLATEP